MNHIRLSQSTAPAQGRVRLSGSKSDTNRALIAAALASGTSRLIGASDSEDSQALCRGLRQLGVQLEEQGHDIVVHGGQRQWQQGQHVIDVGPAGTTMRFLLSVCAQIEGAQIELRGSERMHQRPIGDLVQAWRSLGVKIDDLQRPGCPPLLMHGTQHFTSQRVRLPGNTSSQFLSSLLLAAPMLPQGLTIEVEGEQISQSYIQMTIATMQRFGVSVAQPDAQTYHVPADAAYAPCDYVVEGDASGASYLWGLAALTGGSIALAHLPTSSLQGDLQFSGILERMGCTQRRFVADGLDWVEVQGNPTLAGITVDMRDMPDTAQTLAVIAAFAQGHTHITGLQTLRHKETDRLQALHQELAKVGIDTEITDDSITIHGGSPKTASIATYDDHRMAMSFALLAARIDGVVIQDPAVVGKSFPRFWDVLSAQGVTHT